ncbi:MAG: GGDEF domain-containing protein [Bacteriovoracaceae bacterium]|nr:GGDEF domain-containing protein [Bacteriovoracaceae bacterium]
MSDDSTIVITDIKAALSATDREAEEKDAALLAVGGPINGTLFDIGTGETSCGRSAQNTIPLEFQGVSRSQFVVHSNDGYNFVVNDAGSKNGTFLNNQKLVGPTPLNKGDIIKVGSIALRFLPKGDPERLTYDKLSMDANTDGLTSCYNKMYFNNQCELEVKKSKVTGTPLALILFDLDHFKNLNDNYGHDAGDYVLKDLSGIIRKNGVRDPDIFARYGGEEFVILLPMTNLKQGYEIAERLRKLVEDYQFIYDDQRLPVTASIGVADYRQGVLNGNDLFRRADNAVYMAKDNGRNQVQFFKG